MECLVLDSVLGLVPVHTARTMMLEDLQLLLSRVSNPDSPKSEYLKAIIEDNCLGKLSERTRLLTSRHLVYLYSLDPSVTIFRALRYFWGRDLQGQPILALLCSYSRDNLLRLSAQFILQFTEGQTVSREALGQFIDEKVTGFSKATLRSTDSEPEFHLDKVRPSLRKGN